MHACLLRQAQEAVQLGGRRWCVSCVAPNLDPCMVANHEMRFEMLKESRPQQQQQQVRESHSHSPICTTDFDLTSIHDSTASPLAMEDSVVPYNDYPSDIVLYAIHLFPHIVATLLTKVVTDGMKTPW